MSIMICFRNRQKQTKPPYRPVNWLSQCFGLPSHPSHRVKHPGNLQNNDWELCVQFGELVSQQLRSELLFYLFCSPGENAKILTESSNLITSAISLLPYVEETFQEDTGMNSFMLGNNGWYYTYVLFVVVGSLAPGDEEEVGWG